ncbi:MAG: alpha-ketoglutarate-dependent dioxygenase AlkB [Acidobacteria bacterium]|nr:alpha-ketoglutarate-dependent dioxygenase AlkB [Acidobacteriota bacterium]MBV9625215.1 alpha-ketoglutarate-dependent dioxygenase AlkB [Acidobacteriota bacterium]
MDLISVSGAQLYYDKGFLTAETATQLFEVLIKKCAWQRHRTSFGSAVPRDECYYGDEGAYYRYSRRDYRPLPWLAELLTLKAKIEQATPAPAYSNLGPPETGYNAVLCNLYRDGNDSVGPHADAEPEMGPVIASVSLGVERLFRLRQNDGTLLFAERLAHGSLLIMAGNTQKNCRHEVPKEPAIRKPRINLTFRHIEHNSARRSHSSATRC